MWVVAAYVVGFLLVGVGLSGLACVPLCWRCCWPRGQPLPFRGWAYTAWVGALAGVVIIWSTALVLWFMYSPISVCDPLMMRSAPPDREATTMHHWEGFWCTRLCGESALLHPTTIEEVATHLSGATSLRVVGSGHSATDLQCPDPGGLVMSIDGLCNYVGLLPDGQGGQLARFSGGCTISNTQKWLMAQGYQLVGYGAIMSQTVAGALATSLHGEFTNHSFGDNLVGARAVLADGSIRDVVGDEVHAWVGSMGELGVMVEVTMRVWPTIRVLCETRRGSQAEAMQALSRSDYTMLVVDTIIGADTGDGPFAIRTCLETASPRTGEPIHTTNMPDGTASLVYETYGLSMLRLASTLPTVRGPMVGGFLLAPAHAPHEENALDAWMNSAKGTYNVYPHSELAVPMEHCNEFLTRMAAEANRLGVSYIIAIKIVAPSQAWRTWAVHRSCSINLDFYAFGLGDSVTKDLEFRAFCETMAVHEYGGGLHLGKMWVHADRQSLLLNAPRAGDFETLRLTLDPTGKLQNEHTRSTHGDGECTIPPLPVELDVRSNLWRGFVWLGVAVSLILSFTACGTYAWAYRQRAMEPSLVPARKTDGLPLLGLNQ